MVKGYLSQLVNVIKEYQVQLNKGGTLPTASEKIKQQALFSIDKSVSSIQNVQKMLQKQSTNRFCEMWVNFEFCATVELVNTQKIIYKVS